MSATPQYNCSLKVLALVELTFLGKGGTMVMKINRFVCVCIRVCVSDVEKSFEEKIRQCEDRK